MASKIPKPVKQSPATTSQTGSKAPKNIKVLLRIRPPIGRELTGSHTCDNIQTDPSDVTKVSISHRADKNGGIGGSPRIYHFDRVFDQKSHNKELYEAFGKSAVNAAFEGQHGVLFVYGQTGSGKTFTVSNEQQDNPGVLQQALFEVWSRINNDKQHEYKVTLSYVQLYKEVLTNLLADGKEKVRLQSSNDNGVEMVKESTGLPIDIVVTNYGQTMQLFTSGMKRKEMGATDMNMSSSRSHTIFNLNIYKKSVTGPVVSKAKSEDAANSVEESLGTTATELQGRLYLCDLAGSERVNKTRVSGNSFDEATSINGSLLVLGKVVAALTDKSSQHAPFRESKLTRILQYALTGNGNTSLVVNVSPSDDNTDETHSAILFGQRANKIKQDAKRHVVMDYKAMYLQLQADLDTKTDELIQVAVSDEIAMYESTIANLKEQLKFSEEENCLLKVENAQLRAAGGAIDEQSFDSSVRGNVDLMSPSQRERSIGLRSDSGATNGWAAIVDDLKLTLAKRDEKESIVDAERVKLALLLSEEKSTTFRLAEKLRALAIKYQSEKAAWAEECRGLKAEIASIRGTEYLSTAAGICDDDNDNIMSLIALGSAATSDELARMNIIGSERGGDTSSVLQQQLDRCIQTIENLYDERTSLIVYQSKSQKAIKLLALENAALGGNRHF
eukprot:Tbor_TRINITY_DN4912_c0_g1::TRINITY_DN4912_c0_g1_i1::g.9864::m.9864